MGKFEHTAMEMAASHRQIVQQSCLCV